MASEPSSLIENLINSRNRDISLFLPFIIGLNAAAEDPPDRIVLINPFTQGMVVIERRSSDNNSSSAFESLLDELFSRKSGRPPASKAAIDAMESVEAVGGEDNQCAICLEEWEKAKRMPCKHSFHGECIENWLNIHGSCPICRYEMPVDGAEDEKKRRGIWVSFAVGGERRSGESDDDDSS
ncbi:E3 ubiquitin-protein ligase MPSR1-like [Salvia miltiorrhiza]|uniref:E3 ubiquitin-protein ligase MPSR1-like n=1 Tax=Salvia miltiorrhiza TaxID=226208 RepID=UPI0025AC68E4|nr:E3 ubiquitin-protein ligase MPSR1-like [Salvia miltiorrhiza]